MMDDRRFTITEQHLKLIRAMQIDFDASIEFGAPAVDPKRPYGNSSVYVDMRKILGMPAPDDDMDCQEEEERALYKLHEETATALQIAVATGSFEAGEYRAPAYTSRWEKV